MEDIKNIIWHQSNCGPKPLNLKIDDISSLVGKTVKKAFPTNNKNYSIEHMWVKITGIKNGKLIGWLDNDPIFSDLKYQDEVEVDISEIEQIF